MSTTGYLNKYAAKKGKDDSKSIISQQSSKQSEASEMQKAELVSKMQQNEEKHKQLMLENNRRRKEKERLIKQEQEERLKKDQEYLKGRKKDKEQAYINYLRNNSKNILNEFKQQNPQRMTDYPKQAPKPPIKKQQQTNYETRFEALDLETSQLSKNKNLHKHFKENLNTFEVMRSSELLDSLDLSQCKPKQNPKREEIQAIVGLPEEDSQSEEEDDLWHQTMKNGKLVKNNNKKPTEQIKQQWAEQVAAQADDVLSKFSQPQSHHQQSQHVQAKQQSKSPYQKPAIQKQQYSPPKPVVEQRKPPPAVKITTKVQTNPNQQRRQSKPQPQQQQSMNSKEEQNHMKEFLHEDLVNINDVELKLQMELQSLNKENKTKLDQINQKFGVRNLQTSNQVNRNVFVPNQGPIRTQEESIEASLLKLDLMLQQPPPQQKPQKQPIANIAPQQNNAPPQQSAFLTQPQGGPDIQYILEQQQALQQQLIQTQQQLLAAQQQQIQQSQQPQQTQQFKPQVQQQAQSNNTMRTEQTQYPKFPSYVLHQDHQSFVSIDTPNVQTQVPNQQLRPRNVISHDGQSISIVSSQQSDKYNYDLDFGQAPAKNSYQQQLIKKTAAKQSLVKPQSIEEQDDEEEDGKIQVRHDLKNLLFD